VRICVCFRKELGLEQLRMCLMIWDLGMLSVMCLGWFDPFIRYWKESVSL